MIDPGARNAVRSRAQLRDSPISSAGPDAGPDGSAGGGGDDRVPGPRPVFELAKRFTDIVGSTILLVVSIPVMAAIGLAIKLDSRGPVFHRTARLGRHGSTFTKFKFRTMQREGERLLEELLARDPEIREEYRRTYKIRNDPRVTRVGRLLRRTSLDELPQLWNILRGDMSLVGPRDIIEPELEDHYDHCRDTFLSVKPGLTGLWQVSGRSRLPYRERVRLDLHYIRHRSLWLDATILIRTIPAVVRGDGAV